MPAPEHLGPLELNRVMDIADVETVLPACPSPDGRPRTPAGDRPGLAGGARAAGARLVWAVYWPHDRS